MRGAEEEPNRALGEAAELRRNRRKLALVKPLHAAVVGLAALCVRTGQAVGPELRLLVVKVARAATTACLNLGPVVAAAGLKRVVIVLVLVLALAVAHKAKEEANGCCCCWLLLLVLLIGRWTAKPHAAQRAAGLAKADPGHEARHTHGVTAWTLSRALPLCLRAEAGGAGEDFGCGGHFSTKGFFDLKDCRFNLKKLISIFCVCYGSCISSRKGIGHGSDAPYDYSWLLCKDSVLALSARRSGPALLACHQ